MTRPSAFRAARADGLDKRRLAPQKALFVRVENGDQPHFRHIQPFAQKIDPAQHVKLAAAQAVDDIDAFERVDIAVHIPHFDAVFFEIVGQIFRHALGERRDQHTPAGGGLLSDLGKKIVDLPLDGAHLDLRVEQARRTDDLFDDLPRLCKFVLGGRRRDADHLRDARIELLKGERPVVVGRTHTEPVSDQIRLAGKIPVIHRAGSAGWSYGSRR